MDLRQIYREDVCGPLFGQVLMSRSKVKGQGQGLQGQKRTMHSNHPHSDGMQCAGCQYRHAAADGTIPSLLGVILAA